MKKTLLLFKTTLVLCLWISTAIAQENQKPELDFEVSLNTLTQTLEIEWPACLENSIIKLLDNNLNPIKTQSLCKEVGASIDVSNLQQDLYFVQIEHYTGVGLKAIVMPKKEVALRTTALPSLNFVLAPNPATESISITVDGDKLNSTLTIFDLKGQKIQSSTINSTQTVLDISNLAKGSYFVRLEHEQGIGVQQMIKR